MQKSKYPLNIWPESAFLELLSHFIFSASFDPLVYHLYLFKSSVVYAYVLETGCTLECFSTLRVLH